MHMTIWRDRLKKRYAELKAEKKATQESIAQEIGISQGAFAHWLSGRRSPENLEDYERLAKALGMHPAELLYGIGETTTPNEDIITEISELSDEETKQVKAFVSGLKSASSLARE